MKDTDSAVFPLFFQKMKDFRRPIGDLFILITPNNDPLIVNS